MPHRVLLNYVNKSSSLGFLKEKQYVFLSWKQSLLPYVKFFLPVQHLWWGFPGGVSKTHLPMQETQETQVQSLDWEDPLVEGTATHSSILTWRTPWTEEPGGLQAIRSQRVMWLSTHARVSAKLPAGVKYWIPDFQNLFRGKRIKI